MNHAFFVRRFECLRDLLDNLQGFAWRGSSSRDPFCKGFAFNKLHNEEVPLLEFLKPVERGDVFMVERGEQFRFTLKT